MPSPRYIPPDRWPWLLTAYLVAGVAVGLTAEPLNSFFQIGFFTRAGRTIDLGIIVAVNLLFPAALLVLGLFHPRIWTIWLGAALGCLGFTLARAAVHQPHIWLWTPALPLNFLSPFVVVGALVGASISSIAALAIRPLRRVGIPDDPLACKTCGYSLAGTPGRPCPECGTTRPGSPQP